MLAVQGNFIYNLTIAADRDFLFKLRFSAKLRLMSV